MLKTVITPQESAFSLSIPAHYVGKRLEVLIYSTDEMPGYIKPDIKKPSDYFGTLTAQEGEQFQNYIAESRLEWDRNI